MKILFRDDEEFNRRWGGGGDPFVGILIKHGHCLWIRDNEEDPSLEEMWQITELEYESELLRFIKRRYPEALI